MAWLAKLLGLSKFKFDKINIEKDVVYSIINLALANYPREFIAYLQGKVKNNVLNVYGLLYQHYKHNFHSASIENKLPLITDFVGSVHSHPSYGNYPSNQDLQFFNKNGLLHLIICKPFTPENIRAFNLKGEELIFNVK
mgnify:CR=1 FL=1